VTAGCTSVVPYAGRDSRTKLCLDGFATRGVSWQTILNFPFLLSGLRDMRSSKRDRIVIWKIVRKIVTATVLFVHWSLFPFVSGGPSQSYAAVQQSQEGTGEAKQTAPWKTGPPFQGAPTNTQPATEQDAVPAGDLDPVLEGGSSPRIEAAIISPFQSASVATEVGGIIDTFKFELGDLIGKGETVAEISKKRYALAVRKAEERIKALNLACTRAEQERDIKSRLVSMDAGSVQDFMKAEAELEITQHKIRETEIELEQARLDLHACQVRAPFPGHLAIRYKEPHEAVAGLEKLFFIVDSSKVYAVANVPENLVLHFKKGSPAKFNHASGKQFVGTVEKVEPLMDPKTDTKKIHVLIDNSRGDLEPGMNGSVEAGE
jgi:membrane fusion protein, multidrug efflux system